MIKFPKCTMRLLVSAAACCLIFTGCSTTQVSLTYDPSRVAKSTGDASNAVEIAVVTDHRESDPNWLGAIRSGFGSELKTLETTEPVKELVKTAYADGLRACGMLATAAGRYELRINIIRFNCNQYVRREAHIRFEVFMIKKSTSRKVYDEEIIVDKVTGDGLTFDAGVFASVEDLRVIANQVLQEAVDKTLNDPKFVGGIM